MDTLASCLRGRGAAVIPMIVNLGGCLLTRLVWIATILRCSAPPAPLYTSSYPISWADRRGASHLPAGRAQKMNDQLKEEPRLAA